MSDINLVFNSENKEFAIYNKLYGKDYFVLVETEDFTFIADNIPVEINGEFYFKNTNIQKLTGKNIPDDYCGGKFLKIEIAKNNKYKRAIDKILEGV